MGILLSGISIGGLLVPLVAFSIETFGWRDTSFYSGFLCWAIGVPVASLMRHKPEPYGYRPDGDAVTPVEEENGQRKGDLGTTTDGNTDFTVMEALRTRPFWIIALAHGFSLGHAHTRRRSDRWNQPSVLGCEALLVLHRSAQLRFENTQ